jgi:hypothetical protein
MTINRKLNPVPMALQELRPGNMVRCWGVKICGDLTKDPQHFIVTDIDQLTGHVLIEWAGELPFKVKNPKPHPPYYFDNIITVDQDVFHQEQRHISELLAIELWEEWTVNERLLKDFRFVVQSAGMSTLQQDQYLVKVFDTVANKNSITIDIWCDGSRILRDQLWYVHELQNIIFRFTGIELENNLTRRIIVDRPGTPLLTSK